jgi:hypothetical protein
MKRPGKKTKVVILITLFIIVFLAVNAIMEKQSRLACYGITDAEAIKLSRDNIKQRLPVSPDWQALDALNLEVLSIEEHLKPTPEADNSDYYGKTVRFGRDGKRLLRVTIYSDCGTEWSN